MIYLIKSIGKPAYQAVLPIEAQLGDFWTNLTDEFDLKSQDPLSQPPVQAVRSLEVVFGRGESRGGRTTGMSTFELFSKEPEKIGVRTYSIKKKECVPQISRTFHPSAFPETFRQITNALTEARALRDRIYIPPKCYDGADMKEAYAKRMEFLDMLNREIK